LVQAQAESEPKPVAIVPAVPEKPVVDREWDKKFKDWQLGMGDEPGSHPYSQHLWNIDRERFIEERTNPQELWY